MQRREYMKQKLTILGETLILILIIATVNAMAGKNVQNEMYIYNNYAWLKMEGQNPIALDSLDLITFPYTNYTSRELGTMYEIHTKNGVIETKRLTLGDFITTDNQIIPKEDVEFIRIVKNRKYNISFENSPDYILVKQNGISWSINHKLELSTNEMASFATISNQTDLNFNGFDISLIAGVHETQPRAYVAKGVEAADSISVENVSERKRIELGTMNIGAKENKTKVIWNQTIQPTKEYVDDGSLKLEITFKSQKELPAGKISVFENGIYVGSDYVSNTAKGEEVTIDLDGIYDVSSAEKVIDRNVKKCRIIELHEITIKNYKSEPIHVKVRRNTSDTWKITESNVEFNKNDEYAEWNMYVKDVNKLTYTKEYIPLSCS